VAAERARRSVAEPDHGPRIRLGTSTGLGVRLDGVLAALRSVAPELDVRLISAATRIRLDRVRAGQLDAAFVRGIEATPGLEIIPVWQDELVAVLPASHPLAAVPEVELSQLAAMPLRIVSRSKNQPLADLVMSACATAGFEPLLGPPVQTLQDTLAAIGTGPPAWTVLYSAHAQTLKSTRVAFRPFKSPGLAMTTALAVPAEATSRSLAPLLRACTETARTNRQS
jgi:DNA-binding transcriptional LysR family regulator